MKYFLWQDMPIRLANAKVHEQESVERPDGYHFDQLIYTVSGSGIFTDETGAEHTIRYGQIMYIPASAPHSYSAKEGEWTTAYAVFCGQSLGDGLMEMLGFKNSCLIIDTDSIYRADIENILFKLAKMQLERNVVMTIPQAMLVYKLVYYVRCSMVGAERWTPSPSRRSITPVLEYINKLFYNDISVPEISDKLAMSPSSIYSLFRRELNTSPHKYLTQLRIDYAKRLLLLHQDFNVADICEYCGLSFRSFISGFKSNTGMTPSEYRIQHIGDSPELFCFVGYKTELHPLEYKLPVYTSNAGHIINMKYMHNTGDNFAAGYSFMYCTNGNGIFTDNDGKEHIIEKNDLLFYRPSQALTLESVSDAFDLIWMRFGGKYIDLFLDYLGFSGSNIIHEPESEDYNFADSIEYMYLRKWNNDFETALDLSVRAYELIIHASRALETSLAVNSSKIEKYIRLQPAFNIINSYYSMDIIIPELADTVGLSNNQFLRLFKSASGKSPKQYITEMRIERAKYLLVFFPSKKLSEIAAECGFRTDAYLCRVFKKLLGTTPEKYRSLNLLRRLYDSKSNAGSDFR